MSVTFNTKTIKAANAQAAELESKAAGLTVKPADIKGAKERLGELKKMQNIPHTSAQERNLSSAMDALADAIKDAQASTQVPKKPTNLQEVATVLRAALRGLADSVQVDMEDRVMIRFSSSNTAAVEKALEKAGVEKRSTGIRDVYSLNRFDVALSPWQGAIP